MIDLIALEYRGTIYFVNHFISLVLFSEYKDDIYITKRYLDAIFE